MLWFWSDSEGAQRPIAGVKNLGHEGPARAPQAPTTQSGRALVLQLRSEGANAAEAAPTMAGSYATAALNVGAAAGPSDRVRDWNWVP